MIDLRIVVASTRPIRLGPAIADWVRNQVPGDVFAVEVIDLAELALPFLDEPQMPSSGVHTKAHTLRWKGLVDAADAMVFVMPEYNGSFNAPLKNAIDYLYAEWHGKPIGLVGYGYRAATSCREQLRTVFGRVRADVVGEVGVRFADHLDGDPGPEASVRPDDALRRDTDALYAGLRAAVEGSPVD